MCDIYYISQFTIGSIHTSHLNKFPLAIEGSTHRNEKAPANVLPKSHGKLNFARHTVHKTTILDIGGALFPAQGGVSWASEGGFSRS